eukprot:4171399-Amphidinium_carterae.1
MVIEGEVCQQVLSPRMSKHTVLQDTQWFVRSSLQYGASHGANWTVQQEVAENVASKACLLHSAHVGVLKLWITDLLCLFPHDIYGLHPQSGRAKPWNEICSSFVTFLTWFLIVLGLFTGNSLVQYHYP